MTVEYLEAAQSLFEFGVLSHTKISDINSPVLQKMEEGFLFFVGWADYCYGEGKIDFLKSTKLQIMNVVLTLQAACSSCQSFWFG